MRTNYNLPMAVASLALTAASINPALAQSEPVYTAWEVMNAGSFDVTVTEMDNRCLEMAAVTTVTIKDCSEAKAMLQAGQCDYRPIPDGTRYEGLLARSRGQSTVLRNKEKRIGAARWAYSCQTSSGRLIDWFMGEDRVSCGNVGGRPLAARDPEPDASRNEERQGERVIVQQAERSYAATNRTSGVTETPTFLGGGAVLILGGNAVGVAGSETTTEEGHPGPCTRHCAGGPTPKHDRND